MKRDRLFRIVGYGSYGALAGSVIALLLTLAGEPAWMAAGIFTFTMVSCAIVGWFTND